MICSKPFAAIGIVVGFTACSSTPPPSPPPAPEPQPPAAIPEPTPIVETKTEEPDPPSPPPPETFKAKPKVGEKSRRESMSLPLGNTLGFVVPHVLAQPAQGKLRLHFMDVGQGDSNLIECPDGKTILIDGGSGLGSEAAVDDIAGAKAHIKETLAGRTLDWILVTHPDRDHHNGLTQILDGIDFRAIQLVGPKNGYETGFIAWFDALPAPKKRPTITTPKHDPKSAPNTTITCGAAKVFILAAGVPAVNTADNFTKNTRSLVLLFSYGDFDAVLTGDATTDTEAKILGWYDAAWLDVELLKIGHHGSQATSTGANWLAATQPEVAVVSAGKDNSYGHPRKEVIERVAAYTEEAKPHAFRWYTSTDEAQNLKTYKEAIYGTASSGTIVVESDGDNYTVIQEH